MSKHHDAEVRCPYCEQTELLNPPDDNDEYREECQSCGAMYVVPLGAADRLFPVKGKRSFSRKAMIDFFNCS